MILGFKILAKLGKEYYGRYQDDFQYELNRTDKVSGKLVPCSNGLHACLSLYDALVFHYRRNCVVCAVTTEGNTMKPHEEKYCARNMTIMKILSVKNSHRLYKFAIANTNNCRIDLHKVERELQERFWKV